MVGFDGLESALYVQDDLEYLAHEEDHEKPPEHEVLLDNVAQGLLVAHADVDQVEHVLHDESVEHDGHVHAALEWVGQLVQVLTQGGAILCLAASDALAQLVGCAVDELVAPADDGQTGNGALGGDLQTALQEGFPQLVDDQTDGGDGHGLDHDVDPHEHVHQRVALLDVELELVDGLARVLEREAECGPGVHEQVDPEQLQEGEGVVLVSRNSHDHDNQDAEVYRELLLDELLHVGDHVAPLDDRVHQHVQFAFHQHDVGGVDGGLTRVYPHFDGHVRLLQDVHFLVLVAGHAGRVADCFHQAHLDLLYFLRALLNAEYFVELLAHHVFGLFVYLFKVFGSLLPVFQHFFTRHVVALYLEFVLDRHVENLSFCLHLIFVLLVFVQISLGVVLLLFDVILAIQVLLCDNVGQLFVAFGHHAYLDVVFEQLVAELLSFVVDLVGQCLGEEQSEVTFFNCQVANIFVVHFTLGDLLDVFVGLTHHFVRVFVLLINQFFTVESALLAVCDFESLVVFELVAAAFQDGVRVAFDPHSEALPVVLSVADQEKGQVVLAVEVDFPDYFAGLIQKFVVNFGLSPVGVLFVLGVGVASAPEQVVVRLLLFLFLVLLELKRLEQQDRAHVLLRDLRALEELD
mmetsp:Transcript_45269/g.98987  ORF Transcript_45269/g.98987 Transcript_45269/m.98987 type:complete len:633 (-) Transcript_45269:1828-3726(-)|eukprot:CAMPEP_0116907996 /NCGR_PEP_ID=MMETSP0467-20121206/13433_1 /TAXON_ID=283647 /ORGANISM="Mesodinium pulex, Strain SPMC105" /LENGTH=632 /DNA_ID=CAMNT_0004583111 /DNA_START=240 /DNA_END=2138 /DNA_ORIENTATION=-